MERPSEIIELEQYNELEELAKDTFRERSEQFERDGKVPKQNLEEIADLGMLGITVSEEYGGWGHNLDLDGDNGYYTQAIRTIARGCSSTAHCAQLQYHSAWLIQTHGTEEQKERFLEPMVNGEKFATIVGSEPNRPSQYRFNTTAEKVEDGYIINGAKNYATNGPIADRHILFASLEGASTPDESHMMFMVPSDAEGLSSDSDWYNPIGMNAAASPMLELDNVFVSEEDLLGEPGSYVNGRWQGRYHLGFTATYLGSLEGAFDFYCDYAQEIGADPYDTVQMRTGEIEVKRKAAESLFHDAIRTWRDDSASLEEKELTAMKAKMFNAESVVELCNDMAEVAGTTSLFEEYPLSQYIKNMRIHSLHARHDITAQIVGKSNLNEDFDATRER